MQVTDFFTVVLNDFRITNRR
ncbi:hypothetical protein D030_1476A, partial [Vibrio parahaemolyticus AQ3810]